MVDADFFLYLCDPQFCPPLGSKNNTVGRNFYGTVSGGSSHGDFRAAVADLVIGSGFSDDYGKCADFNAICAGIL